MNSSVKIVCSCLFALLLFGIQSQAFSQKTISGVVLDSTSEKTLSLVNISIKHKDVGTVTNEKGRFNIVVPADFLNDTLVFSRVGYEKIEYPINTFSQNKITVKLKEAITRLEPIQINSEKLVERKFGIKRRGLGFHFTDGILYKENSFEIGQLIKLKDARAQITSVHIYLFNSERDSATFGINFYKIENGIPSERLFNKNIIQKHPIKQGWLKLDITKNNIILKGNFVVTLELIPNKDEVDKKFLYEIKLGGSSRSYYRISNSENWKTPPHHYCMYVTALVDKSTPVEPDELETLPSTSIWSEHVKDSFDIFISLPKKYKRKKKLLYPIIYCLDANAYFDQIRRIVKESLQKKVIKTEPIIVGIGYDNAYFMDSLRVRDYTFPQAPSSDSLVISGGGENFYKFLQSELTPYINKNYQADSKNSTIIGHSFGGYFVGYSLLKGLNGTPIFKNYVAASPSLWYSNGYLVEQFDSLTINEVNLDQLSLFLTSGAEELKFGNEVYFQSFENSTLSLPIIKLQSKIYPRLDHLSAAIPSFEDAIKDLFSK